MSKKTDTEMTTRQRIAKILRSRPGTRPTALSDALSDYGIEMSPEEIVREIPEVHDSLDDERVLVAPPECRDCGFDDFDNPANIPSQCPDCRGEWIEEPEFKIEFDG